MSLFGNSGKDELERPRSAPRGPDSNSPPTGESKSTDRGTADAAPAARGGPDLASIGQSITIMGDLTGNEDLVIDGNIEGRIDLPNNQLTIGPE